MTHPFYQEHETFMEAARRFLDREIAPHLDDWEEGGEFPSSVFPLLGSQGYLGLLLDEKYGGVGGDYHLAAAWCDVFGELCAVGFTTGVNMHSLVISHALEKFGSEAAKDLWLAKACAGAAIGAYAFTEPGAGSDLARITTRADKSERGWIIRGAKTFITNGKRADFVLVLARTDLSAGYGGFTTFVVDTKTPGFAVSRTLDKLGWRSSDTAELLFDGVEVPEWAVLGEVGEGWKQAVKNLNWERVMLTLLSLAGARTCLRDTRRYASERHAFGTPIAELPTIAGYLTEMERRLFLGEALLHSVVRQVNAGVDCRVDVALAKRKICDDAVWIADRAIQIHGGYGYTKEFRPERWWRDLRLMPIGGGTSEIMTEIVVKEFR
jgi:acyl-CoA dehydrogenase